MLSDLVANNDTALKWILRLSGLQHPPFTGENTVTLKEAINISKCPWPPWLW